ncbi:MAG: amino acid permease [Flavobacteriales bacterium]|nr:amino acid permease [Flavobacteriales bacterium]MBP9080289.1 amino acid permease [Flavobacteriales bacterium]
MPNPLFRKKSVERILSEHAQREADGHPAMRRTLSVRDLTFMGVAAVIGAGIFSTVGAAAYEGGPGVVFLFIITAAVCGFTALCYAEFAGRVPVSGSAYTYSYVSFGEVVAWVIGWALILEYAIGNVVVAISWSSYFTNILAALGLHVPPWLATDPLGAKEAYDHALQLGQPTETLAWATAPVIGGWHVVMNIPALLIVVLVTALVYIGIHESKRVANGMVILKLVLLAAVALVGLWYIKGANYVPFLPNGMGGVLKGVSAVFFAYIGFDAISTTAEECKDPQRDLPRAMIWSLVICTVIYCVTALVLTGMVPYTEFKGVMDPLAYVFNKVDLGAFGFIVSVGAVLAATSVLLVFQLGQPRIWMSMSRDGLLPQRFGHLHRRFGTPAFATLVTGVLVGIPALFAPSGIITDLTSIGTLFAFTLVCAGVLLLPRMDSRDATGRKRFSIPFISGKYLVPALVIAFIALDRTRIATAITSMHLDRQSILLTAFVVFALGTAVQSFRRNFSLIPCIGMLSCAYLMIEIPAKSWVVFFGWMALGLAVYFAYGRRHSRLAGE